MSWPVVNLGEVATLQRDGIGPEAIESGTRYLGLEHIEAGGRIIGGEAVESGALASTKFRFGPEHVLYGKLRPYLAKIALPDFSGVCSTDILPVLPSDRLDRRYLAYFLRQPEMVEFANGRATGANLPRLSPKSLASFEIPLPPLAEQKRIAAVLDQAARLTRLRAEALARLDTLGQAIFHEMFGDGACSFSQLPLSSILSAIISGFSPKCSDRPARRGEAGILKLSAVTSGKFRQNENKFFEHPEELNPNHRVRVGDLLFTRKNTRDLVAAVAIAGETDANLYLPDLIYRLEIKPDAAVLAPYLHALLASKKKRTEIQLLAGGAAGSMPNISKAKLLEVLISVPPLELQTAFASRLEELQTLQTQAYNAANAAQTLFASLQHRAFRGEL